MSLWEQYKKDHADDILIENVPDSMFDAVSSWLFELSKYKNSPYDFAQHLKNKFRIASPIPTRYANNYSPPDYWKLAQFLINLSQSDSQLFFVVLDYTLATSNLPARIAVSLSEILETAGHKFTVQMNRNKCVITERIPETDLALMKNVLSGTHVYASEFQDAFSELYGTKPNHTAAAGEAFQSLESAIKYYFGDDKGKNLGALLAWLKDHRRAWEYKAPSDGQDDAQEHFIALVDFVNKSYRKIKHGQANAKLTIEKEHAETIIRVVALLIYELENTVQPVPAARVGGS